MNQPPTPPHGVPTHFGPQAGRYLGYRPRYPSALFHYLAVISGGTRLAWDCATGNGQAAVGLAERFARVIATDASKEMIAKAIPHPRVTYLVTSYETGLPDQSANLVTVAQALHWLDLDAFLWEARRVLARNGAFAAWCYTLCRIEPRVDEVVDLFYRVTLGPFWPAERQHVNDGYRSIALPIDELTTPPFEMQEEWTMPHFVEYVRTWSGVERCVAARGEEPLRAFEDALLQRWGNPLLRRFVRWPVHCRVGRLR